MDMVTTGDRRTTVDVVTGRLPWKHADNLIIMATTREERRRKLTERHVSLMAKRLKVTTGRSASVVLPGGQSPTIPENE